MPNKYTKKKNPLYTQEDMSKAIQEVENNELSMYAAAKKYGIPSTTLYDKIKVNYATDHVGRPTAIPLEEEKCLAEAIRTMEKWGFGLSREEILNLVAQFVTENKLVTPFTNNKPGKDWFVNFRKRHNLSIKKAQPVEYVRKKMTDPFVISEYFKLLKETMTEYDMFQRPHLIWNLDETSLSLDPTRTKVVGAVNKPCSRTTCGTGKENITVLTAVNACGQKITPLIVFKGKNVWDQWMAVKENYDFNLAYAASNRGWMETEIFRNYIEKILIPALGDERPVLLIYDGHSTHVDTKVIDLAIQNDVTILKLPPHTSHLLQPLDLAVFKSFKTKWDAKLVQWQRHNVGCKMPKNIFSESFAETWQEINPDVIMSGFKKAGIHPFDPDVIPDDKYDPAAYKRYQMEKSEAQTQLSPKTPKSLKNMCVDHLNKQFEIAEELTMPCSENTNVGAGNVTLLSKHSKQDIQSRPFVANQISNLPECLKSDLLQPEKEKDLKKINIILDKIVTFEDLLLEKIRQDKKDNTVKKKKRVAKGAEVITASYLNEKIAEEKEKKEAKITLKGKGKLKKKQTITSDLVKPGPSGIKKVKSKTQGKKKSKRRRHDSDSSLTSISDIMSIYSETDCVDIDFEMFDTFCHDDNLDSGTEESKSQDKETVTPIKQQTKFNIANDENILIEEDLNTANKKGEKGKGKGKKSKTGKENQHLKEDCNKEENNKTDKVHKYNNNVKEETKTNHESSQIKSKTSVYIPDIPENDAKNKRSVTKLKIEKIPKKETKNKNEGEIIKLTCEKISESFDDSQTEDDKNETYDINDSVLVRYFVRKRWIYYVGFIEDKIQKYETHYTINFLKTIKRRTNHTLHLLKPKEKIKMK